MSADPVSDSSIDQISLPAQKLKAAEVVGNLHVLGELIIRHETVGRIRFYCRVIADESELALGVCQSIAKLDGVKSVRTNVWCAALIVDYNDKVLSRERLLDKLGKMFFAAPNNNGDMLSPPVRKTGVLQKIHSYLAPLLHFLESLLPATIQMAISSAALVCSLIEAPIVVTRSLLFISVVPIGLRAVDTFLIEGRIGVDALDGLASGLMIKSGKVREACFMAALIGLGEFIRERTAGQCRKMVDDLLSLSGRSAWLVKGHKRLFVSIDQVKVGDILVVYPGELIPVDGIVLEGQAEIDQSKLTGESTPVSVAANAQIFASTVLLEGKIYIRCLSVGADTKAGSILQSLKLVPIHETRIQNYAALLADKLVVPIILGAVFCFLTTRNLMRMISILIFDFSTGIRIAAPTAILSSMYNAGRKGILIKNGASLERLAQVSAVVFDKTGTLTLGEPKVTRVIPLPTGKNNGTKGLYEADEIVAMAAAVEQRHHHPASRAIVKYALHKQIVIGERSDSQQVRGMGVKAMFQDKLVVVGSRKLIDSEGIAADKAEVHEEQITESGESIAYVAADGELIGLIAYSDKIRPEAAQAVFQLKKLGVKKIIMATGDGEIVAKRIANICGIEDYMARVFPDQKADLVKELKEQGHTVAVIGDGINDSPALAHADIGFSLHGCTDAAREGADIVLTDGDLRRLPEAIRIARGAINLVKENLTLSIIPNGAGLGLAAVGMVGPAGATLLNNGSAIACALNSMRPLYSDPWSKADPIVIKEIG